ncbi:hypothetical protein [Risungbinella massiliensis]|uniref:hypothetical protein n=1 Tax=Risungbinella massiliensis TaxID=1329796 RepID=UPI0005CC51B0|nr:hypothetical protein [Risungbinella massiliensis]
MPKKILVLFFLCTLFLSACSEEATIDVSTTQKSSKPRDLTYDEKTLFNAFLHVNHVDMMKLKDDAKAKGTPIKGIGSCIGEEIEGTTEMDWFCSGPNALDKKATDLSGTYYIASYQDERGKSHIFLVIPTKFIPDTKEKSNLFYWTADYQSEEWEKRFNAESNSDIKRLGRKGLEFDALMKDPGMMDFNMIHNLDWREIKANKDRTFE